MDSSLEMFQINDFVWVQMKDYPPWPGIIVPPDPLAPLKEDRNMQWIYFFGSHNYSWIQHEQIKPFDVYKDEFKTASTHIYFIKALNEVNQIIDNLNDDPHFKIDFVPYVCKERKDRSLKRRISSNTSLEECKKTFFLEEKRKRKFRHFGYDKKDEICVSNLPQYAEILTTAKKSPSSEISGLIYANVYAGNTLEKTASNQALLFESNSSNHDTFQLKKVPDETIIPAPKKVGVLADNMYAKAIIKNLLRDGHHLFIWIANSQLCKEIKSYASQHRLSFRICLTQTEVVTRSDIIFSCLKNQDQVKATMEKFGIKNDYDDFLQGKGYIEMTSIDAETSIYFCELIHKKEATYLKAMMYGCETDAVKGELLILLAGDQSLFDGSLSCFNSIGKVVFLKEIGLATKIYTILQALKTVFLSGLAECYALVDRSDSISLDAFHRIFKLTPMSNKYFLSKGTMVLKQEFSEVEEPPLRLFHKYLSKFLAMSDEFSLPMPLAACVNQIYKQTRILGYGFENKDPVSVYTRFRH